MDTLCSVGYHSVIWFGNLLYDSFLRSYDTLLRVLPKLQYQSSIIWVTGFLVLVNFSLKKALVINLRIQIQWQWQGPRPPSCHRLTLCQSVRTFKQVETSAVVSVLSCSLFLFSFGWMLQNVTDKALTLPSFRVSFPLCHTAAQVTCTETYGLA